MTNKKPKLKWKVAEKETGRYASFQRRNWPTATLNGELAVQIDCVEDYSPYRARTGNHSELIVRVLDRRTGHHWRKLVQRPKTLEEAKKLAQYFVEANEDFFRV